MYFWFLDLIIIINFKFHRNLHTICRSCSTCTERTALEFLSLHFPRARKSSVLSRRINWVKINIVTEKSDEIKGKVIEKICTSDKRLGISMNSFLFLFFCAGGMQFFSDMIYSNILTFAITLVNCQIRRQIKETRERVGLYLTIYCWKIRYI